MWETASSDAVRPGAADKATKAAAATIAMAPSQRLPADFRWAICLVRAMDDIMNHERLNRHFIDLAVIPWQEHGLGEICFFPVSETRWSGQHSVFSKYTNNRMKVRRNGIRIELIVMPQLFVYLLESC